MTDEIKRELAQWKRDAAAEDRRFQRKQDVLQNRLHELLLRARDVGMSNKAIAAALNSFEGRPLRGPTHTTREVGRMMHDAETFTARTPWLREDEKRAQ